MFVIFIHLILALLLKILLCRAGAYKIYMAHTPIFVPYKGATENAFRHIFSVLYGGHFTLYVVLCVNELCVNLTQRITYALYMFLYFIHKERTLLINFYLFMCCFELLGYIVIV